MNFWLRNIILGLVLIGLAVFFLANQDLLLSLSDKFNETFQSEEAPASSNSAEEELISEDKNADVVKLKKMTKGTNAAAEGLSSFYASINPDLNEKGPRIKNNIVFLPEPKKNLEEILEARRAIVRPLRSTWKGTTSSRPFRLGETLFQKLTEYANADGLEVYWWLNKDFLVKDAFRINKNIVKTTYSVGKAVEGHFINGLNVYFCPKHRAVVLIENDIDYLAKECQLLNKS